MSEVVLSNLVKEYRDGKKNTFRAVKGIDLTIREREFMVLVGPSGCGKSTSLRMIAGLEEITGGTISIGGRVVNDVAPKDRDIAMVFQNYALYPHMSVFDNMAFGLKLMKYPKEEIKRRVEEAAEILGLTTMLERKPKALSGGQRQRVAVGRAIVRKPKVFLFDEPLSNLDAKMRVQMRTEISKLHARLNATMIYVTHDQVEAMTMGTRICVMKDGEIQQVDEPLKLYNSPQNVFTAGFIGSPPMNFFRGKVEARGDEVVFIEEAAAGAAGFSFTLDTRLADKVRSASGRVVVFGIRPEDISVSGADATAQSAIRATVEVSEPMGSETYLYLHSGSNSFIARVRVQDRYDIGSQIRIVFNLENGHLFDAQTEKVI